MRAALATALAVAFALGGAGAAQRPGRRRTCSSSTGRRRDHRARRGRDRGHRRGQRLRRRRHRGRRADHGGEPGGLPRRRLPQHGRQPARPSRRPRCSAFVDGGGGFLGIGSAAQGEAGSPFFDGLIGARPERRQLDRRDRADRRRRRPRAPGDAGPAARARRARTPGTSGARARPARSTPSRATTRRMRRPATAPTSAAPTTPISWCRDYRGGRSFYTGMGRTAGGFGEERLPHAPRRARCSGPPAWSAATARPRSTPTTRARRSCSAGAVTTGLDEQRRVARPRRPRRTAGCSTSAAATAAPTRSAARCSACRRSAASSTTPTRTSASAAAASTSGTRRRPTARQQRRHARRQARRLRRRRPGRRAHQRGRPQDGVRPARRHGRAGLHRDRPHLPAVLPDASTRTARRRACRVERRMSKMSQPRISRFTMDLRDEAARPRLRGADLRVRRPDLQLLPRRRRHGLRLRGQPLRHDRRHELVAGLRRLLRQQPAAKCPTGPDDAPSSAHCGTANYSYQDARRTAGNTNDYNGKMLRFRPIDDPRRPAAAVGAGTTYTLPTRTSPNGPNLFDGTEGGGGKAKPEIYAMGLRNPSRPLDRPGDRHPVHRVGRPGRRRAERDARPVDVRERGADRPRRQLRLALLHGQRAGLPRPRWPTAALRTTNAPGYVSGGPATGGTDGWYDCDNLRNDSPNNTGLVELPHETGTGMDAGKVRRRQPLVQPRQPGSANGCPDFPRDARRRQRARTTARTPTAAVPVRASTRA